MSEAANQPSDEALQASSNGLLPATVADVAAVRDIMQQASEFKRSQGDDLWGDKPFTDEEVTGMLDSGNLYVYKVGDIVAASVLLTDADERMWGEEQGGDGTAIYIHKLCVGADFRGQGVGSKVIELASEQAKSKGKTRLRLDCPYDNRPLCEQYEGMGFGEVRRYDRPKSAGARNPDKDAYRAALYEKDIVDSTPTT